VAALAAPEPLPQGAVARLGSTRLWQPQVDSFTFSPDGKTLAAMGYDSLQFWDVASGKRLREIAAPISHGQYVSWSAPAFSPDWKRVALGSPRIQTIRVWDTLTGKLLNQVSTGKMRPAVVAFAPDGKKVAAAGYYGTLCVWDLEKDKLASWGVLDHVDHLGYSPDGKTLVSINRAPPWNQTHIICLWDTSTGKESTRHTLQIKTRHNTALSPDGKLLVMATPDGKVLRLFDTTTGKEVRQAKGSSYPVFSAFAGDGRTLTASSDDGVIRVWETTTGKILHQIKSGAREIRRACLSHDGKLLALTGTADESIHIWDLQRAKELHTFIGHRGGALTVSFSPDGKSVWTASRDPSIVNPPRPGADWSFRRWDPATGKQLPVVNQKLGDQVVHAVFSPDARLLAIALELGTLRLWDVQAGKERCHWKLPTREQIHRNATEIIARYHLLAFHEPRFSPDGKSLTGTDGDTLYRWETATGKELARIKLPNGMRISAFRVSPDGKYLACQEGFPVSSLVLLDAMSGKKVRQLGRGRVDPLAWSPDGRTVAGWVGDALVLWEAATGRERLRQSMEREYVSALSFSPDSRLVALVGIRDNVIRLWDAATGKEHARLTGHPGRVFSLAFSPDGGRLASAGYENTALVWKVAPPRAISDKPANLTAKQSADLWHDLAGADTAAAYRAHWKLAEAGKPAVVFLKGKATALKPPDAKQIARLIADLNAEEFADRTRASKRLEEIGSPAAEALRKAAESGSSAEVRSRAKALLARMEKVGSDAPPSVDVLGGRVVEVLERIGTADAIEALRALAKGASDTSLTREAKSAMKRLSRGSERGK
jgi:WD40 repeat protein